MTFKEWIFDLFSAVVIVPLAFIAFVIFHILGLSFYVFFFPASIVYPPFVKRYKKYSYNLSIALDQLANASFFGNPDLTISGRIGYKIYFKKSTNRIYVILCKFLSWLFSQDRHCFDAIEFDRVEK